MFHDCFLQKLQDLFTDGTGPLVSLLKKILKFAVSGMHSNTPCYLIMDLWEWCLMKGCFVVATHIVGKLNEVADRLSCSVVHWSDSKLSTHYGEQQKLDPQAEMINSFLQCWIDLRSYAKPPWSLIRHSAQKT